MADLIAIFNTFINIATGVALTVAIFFFIMGALQYTASGGNPAAKTKGATAMMDAGVGFALVLAARIIMAMIQGAIPH